MQAVTEYFDYRRRNDFKHVQKDCDCPTGSYLGPPHVSADPAWVYGHTENPIWLQVCSHAATHHIQGTLRRQTHQTTMKQNAELIFERV